MKNNRNDPAMVDAIARAHESRAQILRSKAAANPAYRGLADKADREARNFTRKLAGLPEERPDPEGTAPTLSDSMGNFAPNPEVAAAGGIGVDASNTNVETGKPAQTAAEAGTTAPGADAGLSGAPPAVGRPRVAETPETRAAVAIPDDWQKLSWQERRSLASQLSDEPVTNGEQANAAIEAELKRRGG